MVLSLDCSDGQNYAMIIKKTGDNANEESFQILGGTTVLYTSPTFANSATRTLETCLATSSSNIYTLKMKDKGNDSWANGAYIEIHSVYGNTVFKGMMTDNTQETYQFSLLTPIGHNADWKYTASTSGNWKDVSFSDNDWTTVTLGSTSQTASGTQYFRKAFTGVNNMAAIDVQLQYKFGVVAYINGVEIYRDNMPTGEVTPTTPATGSYAALAYHGVIRSSSVAQAANSMLAVELHFTESTSSEIDFNALLAFLSGLSSTNNCYVYPTEATVTYKRFSYSASTIDFSRTKYAYTNSKNPTITYEFTGVSIPMIDAFRIWVYTIPLTYVSDFSIDGAYSKTGTYTTIMSTSNNAYGAFSWPQWNRVSGADPFKVIRLNAYASHSTYIYVNEIQFLVCNNPEVSSITFEQTSYSYYRNYESANIIPTQFGFTGCTVSPALPAGLSLNADTCVIRGTSTESRATTTYQVSATVQGQTYQGSFSLTVLDCTGTMFMIQRTYKTSPETEYFRIRDTSNDNILFEVESGHSHSADKDWTKYLCISVERFDVAFYSTGNFWYSGSFFYMYYLLPNNEKETVLKGRYDNINNSEQTRFFYRPSIEHSSNWYYKMGTVPANWYNAETSGWQTGSRGSFPDSTNKVQLYKQTFTISSMENVMGLTLSVRYKYGYVVYLNGHEAFRFGVTGEVGTGATVTNSYSTTMYYVITLPAKSMSIGGAPAVQYLNAGTNTIAIAVLAQQDSQTQSDFDAVLRLMPAIPESHIWDLNYQSTGLDGVSGAFDMYYNTFLSGSRCVTNYFVLTLKNERREWVSSVQVMTDYNSLDQQTSQFALLGRNTNSETWSLLANVTNLSYTVKGQKKRIYLNTNAPYNQFRFENFGTGIPTSCSWKIQSLDLFMDNMNAEPTPLVYPDTVTAIRGIELAEVIPEGEGYRSFSIAPALPAGISMDPYTGWITGTGEENSPETTYTISAVKINGEVATATLRLTVGPCAGAQSLMTVRIRADQYQNENTWTLYEGRGTTGRMIQSVHPFPVKLAYYYQDFCLANNLYTFEVQDSYGDGWQVGTGYTLTVDVGEFELDIQEVPARSRKPVKMSTVFSSYLPFQALYSEWKVFQGAVDADWNQPSFDDSNWSTYKAADIPSTESVTTYIRKTFELTTVNDYQVLNIRMKYAGGVAVYFNGKLFGRFNLEKNFDATTESIAVHDATLFSKFHAILPAVGAQEGTNVVAFEIHRPVGTSSSEPVVFDATGVFGVDDCNPAIDTYSAVSSVLSEEEIASVMDLDPFTVATLPNADDTYLEWTVENLEGSRWNTYNLLGGGDVTNLGFDLLGYLETTEGAEPITTTFTEQQLVSRTKSMNSVPVALIGFVKTRFAIINPGSAASIMGAMYTAYCKASGSICPSVGEYPAVEAGQISPASCPDGYNGYSYRECDGTQLGEVKEDKCVMKVPSNIHYGRSHYQLVKGTATTTGVPRYENIVQRWYVDPMTPLPAGLSINELTGEISGIPTDTSDVVDVIVYGENASGVLSVTIAISVRVGVCKAEGVFPVTEVDQVAEYHCSMQGSYIGTLKCACVLGETDGEWQKATGLCFPVLGLVIIILVVIIIIVVIVLIIVRSSKRTKSVAGRKAKAGKNVKTTKVEKGTNVQVFLVC